MELASKTPFCTNCEYIATSVSGWERYTCLSPENVIDKELNLVNGQFILRRKVETCKEARDNDAFCGKAGKWFKERTFKIVPVRETFPSAKPGRGFGVDDL